MFNASPWQLGFAEDVEADHLAAVIRKAFHDTVWLHPPTVHANVSDWLVDVSTRTATVLGDAELDEDPVTGIEVRVEDYRRGFCNLSPERLIQSLARDFHRVHRLLDAPHSASDHSRLSVAMGELAGMSGWSIYDLGHAKEAEALYRNGLRAARAAEDDALTAVLLEGMAALPTVDARRGVPVRLLEQANSLAASKARIRDRAWLSAVLAHEHARDGNAAACFSGLREAESLTVRTSRQDEARWAHGWDDVALLRFEGACLLWLGDTERAGKALVDALSGLPASQPYTRSLAMVDLATAHVRQGNVEEGCRLAAESLTLVAGASAALTNRRLRELRGELASYGETSAVRDLDEWLMTL